jgi:hypothetical protein
MCCRRPGGDEFNPHANAGIEEIRSNHRMSSGAANEAPVDGQTLQGR